MALATKEEIPVANWLPQNGTGDRKQISSSQLANKKISQRRALSNQAGKLLGQYKYETQ